MRTLNLCVLAFFVTTFYAPAALAIKTSVEEQQKQAKLEATLPENQSDTALYASKLKKMKGHFKEAQRLYIDQKNSVIGQVTNIDAAIDNGGSIFKHDDRWKTELSIGLALAGDAVALNGKVDKDFKQVKDWIKEKELPELFMERHKEAYGKYQTRYDEFESKLKPLQKAKDDDQKVEALQAINEFLEDQQFGRKHQAYDPENLGHSKPASAEGKPLLLTKADYFRAGIDSNPSVQVAALGDFDFTQLPNADDPAFLAESDEVVLSQAVIDKAAELEHDPVKIYHWVRNNIETIPGWGSYQNSDLTLGAQRGNSFDVASLLIALLRASQIPSRYVMGVAEVDAERYTNWLGDFENADVASDYAVANGIAVQVVTRGGEIHRVRTQHMWVQAAIDYFPSRGAKNRSADSWVDLDASFKQYEYLEGVDFSQVTGVSVESFQDQFFVNGSIDEESRFQQGIDEDGILSVQSPLIDHLVNNPSLQTFEDAVGSRRTIVKEYPTLPSELPYTKFNQGAMFGLVPSNLQNRAAVGFNGERTVFPFAKVNNKKITVQFKPATQSDEDALVALLPEGEVTDVNQLPSNIPGFLIRVIPELSLSGEVFRQGNVMTLGDEVNLSYQISGPLTTYVPYNYSVVAGSYLNVPLISQSVSPLFFEELQSEIQATRDTLNSRDTSQINNLTQEDLIGDLFYAGGLAYFAQSIFLNDLANNEVGSSKLEFGYGSYGYEPEQDVFFGVPRGIRTGGIGVNMLFAVSAESSNGDTELRNSIRFRSGLINSALEHIVPEQMVSDPMNPVQGFSSVRALSYAIADGQQLYQIDSNNLDEIMPILNLDFETENQIRGSVRAGNFVIAHERNVVSEGWNGSGYIILDPETLIGTYMISGGRNGGVLVDAVTEPFISVLSVLSAGLEAALNLLIPAAQASGGATFDLIDSLLGFKDRVLSLIDVISEVQQIYGECGGRPETVLALGSYTSVLVSGVIATAVAGFAGQLAGGFVCSSPLLISQADRCGNIGAVLAIGFSIDYFADSIIDAGEVALEICSEFDTSNP